MMVDGGSFSDSWDDVAVFIMIPRYMNMICRWWWM